MNENLYCLVNIPTADTVLQGPQLLPQNWQAPDGTWHHNLANESVWTDPALLAIGWYPYVLVDSGSPGGSPYYSRSLGAFQIQATEVVQVAEYTQWSIDQVKQSKDFEMEQQLVRYQTNELAFNSKIKEYVTDELKWYTDKQADLARITDWQQAADFDSAKPAVLVLPNSHVGQSYVDQGLRMQAENDAATAQALSAPWDQTELNGFVSANQLAANDFSDTTVPVQPNYKLRQGIAVPSEQFARVAIYREARDDPNPALQTTYKMRMFNRQDTRNLYVFSYTNGTYLTWRLFEDLGDGVWGLEATPAEWQYVPGDMGFIFSYGTNPAIEADYFTDRVEFPAGVQTKQILVAWDPV